MERSQIAVCRNCLLALTRRKTPARNILRSSIVSTQRTHQPSLALQHQVNGQRQTVRYATTSTKREKTNATRQAESQDLTALYGKVHELSAGILEAANDPIPSEGAVVYVLDKYEEIVQGLVDAHSIANAASAKLGSSATSALLGSVNKKKTPTIVSKATLLNLVSAKAEEIVRHDNVFITAAVLKSYVRLQSLLQQPFSFPVVFDLYANKPIPRLGEGRKVRYTSADPKSMKAAIDKDTANTALAAAMNAHELSLTLNIIETTFAAPAYPLAKLLRQGAVPITAAAASPLVAYGLSAGFAEWQTMLDPSQATALAFAGFMTYAGAVASVAYVAVTTANDQMDRITWAQGIPLRERWLREEERAALDRVASAWGFKSTEKRGDEEGQDWDILRETVGVKGMVLDKVELMEGME